MLKLNSKNLTRISSEHLAAKQKLIDDLSVFEEKARKAKSLWDGKSSVAFDEIKSLLKKMCVSVEICVYCENNEATDIEHIYPKKLYPKKTFIWKNYILVCGKCNSHHKKDKFKIFKPKNSVNVEDVTLPPKTYRKPANDDALFLNQRKNDPMEFLELDLLNRTFIFIEKFPAGTREYERAKYTIELLGLNKRGALKKARESAALFFISRLEKYVNAKNSNNFQGLKDAVDDFGSVDETSNFNQEKTRILKSIKKTILENQHPTVWKEMLRQRGILLKTNRLLDDAPEVLTW
ncbi:MAG: hypothetical protein LH614_03085 [Pyrinomonadaceae bacterium]|nr:hypothetical protein [Pyrinomonadaceae bacterium]